jgi:hypothetical protein
MSHVTARFGVIDEVAGDTPSIEDRADENTADGILVAEVRGLGTISREVPELAHHALLTPLRLEHSTIGQCLLPKR